IHTLTALRPVFPQHTQYRFMPHTKHIQQKARIPLTKSLLCPIRIKLILLLHSRTPFQLFHRYGRESQQTNSTKNQTSPANDPSISVPVPTHYDSYNTEAHQPAPPAIHESENTNKRQHTQSAASVHPLPFDEKNHNQTALPTQPVP